MPQGIDQVPDTDKLWYPHTSYLRHCFQTVYFLFGKTAIIDPQVGPRYKPRQIADLLGPLSF
jgi:hypothetical protein